MKKIVIVGGGITGLTAAYYLQKKIKDEGLELEVVLIEAENRLGGKMQTYVKDGFVIERGPDSFLKRKTSIQRLAKEVGMADDLVGNSTGKSYVLVKDKLHPMPGGSIMGIPTEIAPFVTTGLFSWPGKFRALGDVFLPREPKGDQSMGKFFRHRLGNEVVDNLIEPLLSGIYAGDLDQMSLISTYEQFYTVEQKYRSLIFGMKAQKRQQPKAPQPAAAAKKGKSEGVFLTFKTGLEAFGEKVGQAILPENLKLNTSVNQIKKIETGYQLELSTGEILTADSLIMATPHQVAQKLFSDYDFFNPLKDVPSTSVTTAALVFPKEALAKELDGTGFVVSRRSSFAITACTWTHKKWEHAAPEGKVILRAYVGRPADGQKYQDMTDQEIETVVLNDLRKIMDVKGEPDFSVITRWDHAMPQYIVNHRERLSLIREEMAKSLPGVFIAGGSYEGIGLPDCIDQGEKALAQSLDFLGLS